MIHVNDIEKGYSLYADEYEKKAIEVLRSGRYILGSELSAFEDEFATYLGVKHCIGVASGLDAIAIALHELDISAGDEVIVPSNTFIATILAVTQNGAIPVFAEPDAFYGIDSKDIETKITSHTKAIIVVHLYGMPCDMGNIEELCKKYSLKLIEDCAQSHGAVVNGKMTGAIGDAGCFSFYPTKNLGAFGDGGCIATNDDVLAERIRVYRNYGSEKKYYNKVRGINSRLDELQAGLLRIKLKYINEMNREREEIAKKYLIGISNSEIENPQVRGGCMPVWYQFVIRCKRRSELIEYLRCKEIETMIHYPVPPHLSEAYSDLNYKKGDLPIAEKYADEVLSIPMYNGLSVDNQEYIISIINSFK